MNFIFYYLIIQASDLVKSEGKIIYIIALFIGGIAINLNAYIDAPKHGSELHHSHDEEPFNFTSYTTEFFQNHTDHHHHEKSLLNHYLILS